MEFEKYCEKQLTNLFWHDMIVKRCGAVAKQPMGASFKWLNNAA